MKVIFSTVLILLTINANAADLLRLKDGYSVTCKSKYDDIKSKTGNVYVLSEPKLKVSELTVEITAKVTFLSCDKVGEIFQFSILKEHMSASYTYPDFRNGGTITATRIDKNKNIKAFDSTSSLVGKSEILKLNDQFYFSITLDKSQLDINNFPAAQEKGNYYTTLRLMTQTKVVTDTIDLGFSMVSSGAYRLFFDLENSLVSF